MLDGIYKFLSWFGIALILGYAITWIGFESREMQGIGEALKTLGWSVFWAAALILRIAIEVVLAILDAIVNFIQGQAPWLPEIPRIF